MSPAPRVNGAATGNRIGPYTLSDALGKGATATVYRGVDGQGQQVAIKVRPRGQSGADRRFLREFESLRTIRIPGVVRVHEAGVDEKHLWFSMDLVEGVPFVEAIRAFPEGAPRIEALARLGRQLLDILEALHQASFIHRDIKPSNVLVDKEGRVRLLDFGIAHVFEDRETTRSTVTAGQLLGTLPYMAPEQLAVLPLTPAADVFGTAIMLHESIAGPRERPAHAFGWIARTCLHSVEPLATAFREFPLGLSKTIEQMLDVDPNLRPTAGEAARQLRLAEAGMDRLVWPEPAFADPGEWWEPLESVVNGDGPRAWVLEGPAGSGRSRIADQLKRQSFMQGRWPIEITCRVDAVGGAVEDLLLALLLPTRNEPWSHRVMRKHAGVLRRVWPTLPLSGSDLVQEPPDPSVVAETVSALVKGVAEHYSLLIIVKHAERVDRLTRSVLKELCRHVGDQIGVLVIHDPRWMTPSSENLVHSLVHGGASHLRTRPPSREAQQTICASLCPAMTPVGVQGSPLAAVRAGLSRLARWRHQEFPTEGAPWALAIRDTPMPTEVLRRVSSRDAENNPWTREGEYGWVLESEFARTSVLSTVDDLPGHAAHLADAWQACATHAEAEVATLRLIAGDGEGAWDPALSAAQRAVRRGRYAEARRWLQVIETLPQRPDAAFDLAALQAEVARVTDPGAAPSQLLGRADRLAQGVEQDAWVELLAAELAVTDGRTRSGLVAALKLGSAHTERAPQTAARALLVAARARLDLGQLEDAARELARAQKLLPEDAPAQLRVRQQNVAADLALARRDLSEARQRSRQALRLASERGHLTGVADCSARLSGILRMLGRRRQAEDYARTARDAYQETGDLRGHAAATLALATLAAERSDVAVARPLLDLAVRRIRGLQLTHLLPEAMRLALLIATIQADSSEATVAMAALDLHADEEAPAAVVRWWRTRGETSRALEVAPPAGSWGLALFHVQRAAALLAAGADCRDDAGRALELAQDNEYAEIGLHAQLLFAEVNDKSAPALLTQARRSLYFELYLGALASEARALSRAHAPEAKGRWETLRARARQLGYRPAIQEADGWLEVSE